MLRLLACLGLVALLPACWPPTAVRERVPARLVLVRDTAEITAPDTVTAGQPFTVTVVTFAGGCIQESAGTEVTVQGLQAQLAPYHYRRRSNVCTDDLVFMPHTVELRFDTPGVARLDFRGASNEMQFGGEPRWITLTRHVVVR